MRLSRLLCDLVDSAGVPPPPVSAFRRVLMSRWVQVHEFSMVCSVVVVSLVGWYHGHLAPHSRGEVFVILSCTFV